jgi:hypothetical protein
LPITGDYDVDSFFTTSGSSPPQEGTQDTAAHDSRPEEQVAACALPEELVEALAGLLAEALVNDIRQYPDLRELTLSSSSLPDPAGVHLTAPPETDTCPSSPQVIRHTSTRSRTRRPARAS